MSALVDTLRRMTAVGKAQYAIDNRTYWTDADLEATINARVAAQLIQTQVELIPSVNAESKLVFLHGRVRFPGKLDTESAAVVTLTGQPIVGATFHDDGRIDFATSQTTTVPLMSGIAYDLNGAAADVLTDWASAVKLGYDITAEGESLTRSQRHAQLLEQAQAFRSRAVIGSISLTRSDVKGARGNSSLAKAALKSFERWGLNA